MSHELSSLDSRKQLQDLLSRAQEIIDGPRDDVNREQYQNLLKLKRLAEARSQEIDTEIRALDIDKERFDASKRRATLIDDAQTKWARVSYRVGFAATWSVLVSILLYFALALPNLAASSAVLVAIGIGVSLALGIIGRWIAMTAASVLIVLAMLIVLLPPVKQVGEIRLEQNSALLQLRGLRDYTARVTGAVPSACFQNGSATKSADLLRGAGRPEGTPLLVELLEWLIPARQSGWFVSPSNNEPACGWRQATLERDADGWFRTTPDNIATVAESLFVHIGAAISPDVGLIQKLTLLIFFFGLAELGYIRLQLRLADIVAEDGVYPSVLCAGVLRDPQDESQRQEARSQFVLFPRRKRLVLARNNLQEKDDPYNALRDAVVDFRNKAKNQLQSANMTTRFVDYVAYVLTVGRIVDHTEAIVERSQAREAIYNDHLTDDFWRVDYVVWLLPTIGFLGTIYGISSALIEAKSLFGGSGENVKEEFGSVVDALGVAFDTTAAALFLVAVLLILQRGVEARVRDFGELSSRAVRERLIDRLLTRDRDRLPDAALTAALVEAVDELKPIDESPDQAQDEATG